MRSISKLLLLSLIVAVGGSGAAFASGFAIFEQGAKATAMGGAFAATADDPSAIFYNVAGIAQQRRMEVLGGGTLINFSNSFVGDTNDPSSSGVKGQYRNHTFVPPNAYVVVPFEKNITFGVGVFTPFGLRTDWANPWAGRFIAKDTNVKSVSIEPAVAWQTDDGGIAIGVGLEYRRSKISLSRNSAIINPFTQKITDVANAYLSSDWDSATGYNVGVLFKSPDNAWRFGASYRSHMNIDYKGKATFTQISTGNAQLDAIVKATGLPPNQGIRATLNFPATEVYALATSAIPNWDIEADVTHSTWSRFKELKINFVTTPGLLAPRQTNWHNTFSYRLGGNRHVTPKWDVRLGALYDENPQPTSDVGPILPDSDRLGATIGLGYHNGPFVVDLSEFVLHFKKRSTAGISADNFNGTYKTDANLISIDFGYRF